MKRALCACTVIIALVLCACGQNETDAVTKMIDFADYSVNEVVEWTNENGVASMFSYVYSPDTDKPHGTVIAQNIESGKPITGGIVITVSSKGMLRSGQGETKTAPNIIGKSFEDAKAQLNADGIPFDCKYEESAREKDTVILSDPLPGISVPQNTKVILTLSTGNRESRVSIDFEIKTQSEEDNVIKIYVDGELDRSKTVCLDPSVTHKVFTFYGTGKKEVKFKINNKVAAVYTVNFSSGEVTGID